MRIGAKKDSAFSESRPATAAWVTILALTITGCFKEPLEFKEVKRIDEKVTGPELHTFLEVVKQLPDEKLPELPPVFIPPPQWDRSRTLSVSDLVAEEESLIEERTSVDYVAKQLRRRRSLLRVLRRAEITPEQFVGLSLAIGVAASRTALRDDQDLDPIIKKGEIELEKLRGDDRPFSELTLEEMHSVLQRAMWITRINRAKRLKQVPPENIALVEDHSDALQGVFPPQFTANALDAVADLLDERGLPFEELPESGSDAQIEWDPAQAFRGTDRPDPKFRTKDIMVETVVPLFEPQG